MNNLPVMCERITGQAAKQWLSGRCEDRLSLQMDNNFLAWLPMLTYNG